jgi:hypothetical protein
MTPSLSTGPEFLQEVESEFGAGVLTVFFVVRDLFSKLVKQFLLQCSAWSEIRLAVYSGPPV